MTKKQPASQQQRRQAPSRAPDDALVEALRISRQAAATVALMAAPERREDAYRTVARSVARIHALIRDPAVRARITPRPTQGAECG